MNHLDLFSGIGGFALAARWAGIETVQFVEIDKFCQKVLAKNFPNVPIHDDIKKFHSNGQIDMVTGGFPCQPFSVAGKKKGFSDDRYLWPEMLRVIRECRPAWIIAENVPGIIPMLDPILEDLEGEGYAWQAYLIPASAIGAPHKRERLWIIANRNGIRCDNWSNHWQERHIQDDWQRHIEKIQSEWPQFFPQSWTSFNAQEWLGFVTDTDQEFRGEMAAHSNAESQRHERTHTATAIGNVISDSNIIPGAQDNPSIMPARESGETWKNDSCEYWRNSAIFNWQKDQPPIFRMDDGPSARLDYGIPSPGVDHCEDGTKRNKSLGNAIVPQIPYVFMRLIKELEDSK